MSLTSPKSLLEGGETMVVMMMIMMSVLHPDQLHRIMIIDSFFSFLFFWRCAQTHLHEQTQDNQQPTAATWDPLLTGRQGSKSVDEVQMPLPDIDSKSSGGGTFQLDETANNRNDRMG